MNTFFFQCRLYR